MGGGGGQGEAESTGCTMLEGIHTQGSTKTRVGDCEVAASRDTRMSSRAAARDWTDQIGHTPITNGIRVREDSFINRLDEIPRLREIHHKDTADWRVKNIPPPATKMETQRVQTGLDGGN